MQHLADIPPWNRFPAPPCAKLLGWRLIAQDATAGVIRVGFEGRPEFLNPAGFVQGGLLAAMLDDTMGPAVLILTEGKSLTVTIAMTVTYVAPVRAGPIEVEAVVIQRGKTIATMEARLFGPDGKEAARAVSSARLVPAEKAVA